jgi:hypothetical protein
MGLLLPGTGRRRGIMGLGGGTRMITGRAGGRRGDRLGTIRRGIANEVEGIVNESGIGIGKRNGTGGIGIEETGIGITSGGDERALEVDGDKRRWYLKALQ